MANTQDITLLIDDQVFNVKKDMLCEYSDYFRAMFSGNYVEKEKQEISIDVIDASSMAIIIRYMELGLLDLSEYNLPTISDLALAANFLQITELIKQIEYCLEQQLSISNWMDMIQIAQNACSVILEQTSVAFGLFSFKLIKPFPTFTTIQSLFWYLSHPYLNTESELQVFQFGLQWMIHADLGADALLILLSCLDMNRLTTEELKEMKDLIKDYMNSLAEKVLDCLYKLSVDFELSFTAIKEKKTVLCELYTEKVYTEVLNLVKESIKRQLKFTAMVPLSSGQDTKPETTPNNLFTFSKDTGYQPWLEVVEKNLWGWNVTAWGPTKIVVVGGEYGRGGGTYMKDVKVYDTLKKEWIRHGVRLPSRRHGSVAVVDNSLFIVGGVGGFRVVLDSALIYNLEERTFRTIAKLPDAVQSPAVCVHENVVYVGGHKNIYKYEDFGDYDRWMTVLLTDIRPGCMISYRGHIYVTQSYFNHLYRFRPGVDSKLEQIALFTYPPVAVCNVGHKLLFCTNAGYGPLDVVAVEEYRETRNTEPDTNPKVIWSQKNSDIKVNHVAGSCAVVLTMPPAYPPVSPYHKKLLNTYNLFPHK